MMLADGNPALILLGALALDAVFGDPGWLWRCVPHPAVLFGRLIGWLDRRFNHATNTNANRLTGLAALAFVIAVTAGLALGLHWLFTLNAIGLFAEMILVAILLAQRSLYDHVRRVFDAFAVGGLSEARIAISMIVGRNPDSLDEAGVCRAAIETTAENFSDGVVAPAFWYLIGGLPGIVVYKAVNTADSMIGHRTSRYEAFGWAAARLDDLLNLIPARLSGFLIVATAFLAGANGRDAWAAMLCDARKHRSPNAGWPEAAMAGALGVALAGPRHYASGRVEDAWMNDGGRRLATPADIVRSLRLFVLACGGQAVIVAYVAAMAV